MVKTRSTVLKERIALEIQRLKLKYFGAQSLEMAIPAPIPPTYQGVSEDEAVEAEDEFYCQALFISTNSSEVAISEEELMVVVEGDNQWKSTSAFPLCFCAQKTFSFKNYETSISFFLDRFPLDTILVEYNPTSPHFSHFPTHPRLWWKLSALIGLIVYICGSSLSLSAIRGLLALSILDCSPGMAWSIVNLCPFIIFVVGLAWETQNKTLRCYFEQFGEILKAVVIADRITARSKGNGHGHLELGLLNFNYTEVDYWKHLIPDADHVILHLNYVRNNLTWESLYPEWIDEEEESEIPVYPSLSTPKVLKNTHIDVIAVKRPCQKSKNWSHDVARLHLQLAAARLTASVRGYHHSAHVLFVTDCFPNPNVFTYKGLVEHKGNAWLYKPNLSTLRKKLRLPVRSCELAVPLKAKGERIYSGTVHREAYAMILHSAHVYVCGAIAAAQSIRMVGSTGDLVILVDDIISEYHRGGLEAAGWKIQTIKRIRNPKAEKNAYNEWNYSKFRLWQLTDYDKIIFIDTDLLILRNINFLFGMPEISATQL
ncbi:hypothetical protein GIB67_009991 [Kingdonia uniflora]|uniref:Hexosyltransferase n=1 Tax=Kingdonia uniflora TaxID=39325 RepID=A0A7J7P0X1_9MAGN|nr:hypothetical protein GIB67_009991 [Kingdonia uniflora]